MTIHQSPRPGKYRVRIEDYLRLDEAGSFGGARTELIEGEIWVVSPASTRHAKAQSRLDFTLRTALMAAASELEIFTAPSLKIADDTMPEPDLVVADDHEEGPLPADKVKIVIEVADSTLDTDLDRKSALYAAGGVPEYWVADVNGRVIHQMWSPEGDQYAQSREIEFGQEVSAATVGGLTIATDNL